MSEHVRAYPSISEHIRAEHAKTTENDRKRRKGGFSALKRQKTIEKREKYGYRMKKSCSRLKKFFLVAFRPPTSISWPEKFCLGTFASGNALFGSVQVPKRLDPRCKSVFTAKKALFGG